MLQCLLFAFVRSFARSSTHTPPHFIISAGYFYSHSAVFMALMICLVLTLDDGLVRKVFAFCFVVIVFKEFKKVLKNKTYLKRDEKKKTKKKIEN